MEQSMNNDVGKYIEKQKSPQKEIIKKVRRIIIKHFPGIKEESKWGVIAYAGGKYYLAGMKERVHLGFSISGLSEKELKLFEGGGKYMRHIKIPSLKDVDEKKIIRLMKLVKKFKKC
jgi:hypothetical protein